MRKVGFIRFSLHRKKWIFLALAVADFVPNLHLWDVVRLHFQLFLFLCVVDLQDEKQPTSNLERFNERQISYHRFAVKHNEKYNKIYIHHRHTRFWSIRTRKPPKKKQTSWHIVVLSISYLLLQSNSAAQQLRGTSLFHISRFYYVWFPSTGIPQPSKSFHKKKKKNPHANPPIQAILAIQPQDLEWATVARHVWWLSLLSDDPVGGSPVVRKSLKPLKKSFQKERTCKFDKKVPWKRCQLR